MATDKLNSSKVSYFGNYIYFKNFNNFKYVSIYDLEGKLLLKTRFSKIINVDLLTKGLYIVSLENDNNIINQKLLVH